MVSCVAPTYLPSESTKLHLGWSAFTARVSNRLARHFSIVPLQLPDTGPMVSFTFDDVPKSAATVGAPMLEEYNGRGTFYVAGALTDQRGQHWAEISPDEVVELH